MAQEFGWAYISGSSVLGPAKGIMFKSSGTQISGSANFTYTAASKIVNLTGTLALSASTAGDLGIKAPEGVRVSGLMGVNGGNRRTIDYAELIPANSVSEVFGPLFFTASGSLTIGSSSHIAVKAWPY